MVADSRQSMTLTERRKTVARPLREGAIQALQLDITLEQAVDLFKKEFQTIQTEKKRSQS